MPSRTKRRTPASRRPVAPKPGRRTLGWPVIAAGVAVIALGVAAVIAISALGSGDDDGAGNALAQQIDTSATKLPAGQGGQLSLGNADAPLVLEVFEDFQCPFCIRFTATSEPVIIEEFVATGKVRLVFQNFPVLGLESEAAARATVCAAEQSRAWPYLLALYSKQAGAGQVDAEKLNVGRFDEKSLTSMAESLGMRGDILDSCLNSQSASAAVADQFARGKALGVTGTPSFAINGTRLQNAPDTADGWRTLLNQRLGESAR